MQKKASGLSAYQLKLIAIVAMFGDHLAYAFLPIDHPLNIVLRFFGKFTFPIMSFFIAEGYYHTHNLCRYAVRLAAFALISHVPYVFFVNWALPANGHQWGVFTLLPTSVLFTLLCGLLALAAWNRIEPMWLRLSLVALLAMLPYWMQADWYFGVLVVLVFGIFHDDKGKQWAAFLLVSVPFFASSIAVVVEGVLPWVTLLQYGGFYVAFFLLQHYNGSRGAGKSSKWLFYLFYPIQFWIIAHISC